MNNPSDYYEAAAQDVIAAAWLMACDVTAPDRPDRHTIYWAVTTICKSLGLKQPNPDDVNVRIRALIENNND